MPEGREKATYNLFGAQHFCFNESKVSGISQSGQIMIVPLPSEKVMPRRRLRNYGNPLKGQIVVVPRIPMMNSGRWQFYINVDIKGCYAGIGGSPACIHWPAFY